MTMAAGTAACLALPNFGSRAAQALHRLRCVTRTIEGDVRAATVKAVLKETGGSGLVLEPVQRFRVNISKDLHEETIMHWRGQVPPNAQDGVSNTNPMIAPGESRAFDYVPRLRTYWMHAHIPAQERPRR